MKIVRLLPFVCALCLLASCGSNSVTGPDADRITVDNHHEMDGTGTMGSGG